MYVLYACMAVGYGKYVRYVCMICAYAMYVCALCVYARYVRMLCM